MAFSTSDPSMLSNSYSVVESEIGGSGCANVPGGSPGYSCGTSSNYSVNPNIDDGGSSLGENAVGNSSSASYQTNSGFDTTAQPGLMVTVSGPAAFGVLNTAVAKTATSTFSVRDYTSSGYVVQIVGSTPTNGSHNLTAMTTNARGDASSAGSEQFGLNLVANTSPANPVPGSANPICQTGQVPGPTAFCSGVAGDGTGTYGLNALGGTPYTVDGRYRYVSGETVAYGPSSSGETDYTITFLANQSLNTPAGVYSGNLDIAVTGTF
jgi:hypothetical protein